MQREEPTVNAGDALARATDLWWHLFEQKFAEFAKAADAVVTLRS
jgi:hypothetical protein